MSVMKRVSLIFRAKANKALDKMEDPRETLDYSYQQQVEMLTRVRRGVADVATSRKRVELQMNQLQKQAQTKENQARTALGQGREDLARAALEQKSGLVGQLASLQEQYRGLQEQEEKLTVASQRLQSKVDAFRTRKETIKATYTAAEAQRGSTRPSLAFRRKWATLASRSSAPRTRPRRCRPARARSTSCWPPARWRTMSAAIRTTSRPSWTAWGPTTRSSPSLPVCAASWKGRARRPGRSRPTAARRATPGLPGTRRNSNSNQGTVRGCDRQDPGGGAVPHTRRGRGPARGTGRAARRGGRGEGRHRLQGRPGRVG